MILASIEISANVATDFGAGMNKAKLIVEKHIYSGVFPVGIYNYETYYSDQVGIKIRLEHFVDLRHGPQAADSIQSNKDIV